MLDKSKTNFVIDALMFACMAAIAGIGFLMKYVLIPGKERWVVYGRNVELYFAGLDRHEWGTIHLYAGFVLLGLLVLHIVLHWRMVVSMYRKLIPHQRQRNVIALVFLLVSIILFLFSFVIKPEVKDIGQGKGAKGLAFMQGGERFKRPGNPAARP